MLEIKLVCICICILKWSDKAILLIRYFARMRVLLYTMVKLLRPLDPVVLKWGK